MRKFFVRLRIAIALVAALPETLKATGGYAPERWLANGGVASDMSPEFYWELEVKRMAREFIPQEKRVLPAAVDSGQGAQAAMKNLTSHVDADDFEDAIKTGRIKPPEPEKAKATHQASRELVTAANAESKESMPEEFPSEFADYHRGAFAFQCGEDHHEEARAAWETLLQRPESERHYRSVWAAFMLGKLALAMKDPSAVQWFRQTRELARGGFADSQGLAADSYGWEARSELDQEHFEAAAKLYLTQLALGDESAVGSLKALIPDRPSYNGDAPPDKAMDEAVSQEAKMEQRFEECARSPLLRRLVTAHVLATETPGGMWSSGLDLQGAYPRDVKRCVRWLATLEKAGLGQIDDADHIGWVAYTAGRYQEAARWLAMAKSGTPTALWLRAKLERRDGRLAKAVASMAAAFKAIREDPASYGDSQFFGADYAFNPEQSAAGDLAGLHLSRGEFLAAMDAFLRGGLWHDAAFLADRVLTVDELKKYVDTHFPPPTAEPKAGEEADSPYRDWRGDPSDNATRMRWMLARRLVREHRLNEARAYFRKKERAALDRYAAALKEAENSKLPRLERARALFTAAWVARHDGMEIMGAEVEPDGFVSEGDFAPGYLDKERIEGVRLRMEFDPKQEQTVAKKTTVKLSIPATAEEKRRILTQAPRPSVRFHYRWVAADLAWRAAAWMNDGTEELADVLNTGGSWIEDRDDKGADKFIQAIERRCPHTKIGQAESVKHWFVDQTGPWSEEMK